MNPGSVVTPKIYIGVKLSQVLLPDSLDAWAVSQIQYIQEAVNNVEGHLRKIGLSLRKGTKSPLMNSYNPECGVTSDLNKTYSSYYASLIGTLRRMVDTGRVDISCGVYIM